MSTIGETIAKEFRRILGENKLTISQAARNLRVSRQAFHSYLNGSSVPRSQTLARAIDLWGFNLSVGGVTLDRNSFTTESANGTEPPPKQLVLWEALDGIKQQDLKINVKRIGSTLRVEVKIDIPA